MTADEDPKVLIVDDEESILVTQKTFLELSGFQVAAANNGVAALERVAQCHPDPIVLDVLMPQLDGRETLRRLRQRMRQEW